MSFLSWANAMIAPPSNGASSSSSCQLKGSNLSPIRNLDPFDCSILPHAGGALQQCQAIKIAYADTVKPDCSRLPPQYQPYCRALQPRPPLDGQNFDPAQWPNTGAALATARQRCAVAASDPRQFYTCMWASTKYPAYPEFQVPDQTALTNRDNCPCRLCAVRTPFPPPSSATGGYTQISPHPYDCQPKSWGEINGLNTTPKVWSRNTQL
jgi:hypothetical protein